MCEALPCRALRPSSNNHPRNIVLAALFATLIVSASTHAVAICDRVEPIHTNARYDAWPSSNASPACYLVEVESAGVLVVRATVPGAHPKPRLNLVELSSAVELLAIDQQSARWVLRAHQPTSFIFEVVAPDQGATPTEHVIVNRHYPASLSMTTPPPLPMGGEVGEIDPILVLQPPPGSPPGDVSGAESWRW